MEKEKIDTQEEFAQKIGTSQQNQSRILKSEKISEQKIQDIIDAFPDYRKEWLLGYDDVPTHSEKHEIHNRAIRINAPITVLYDALREVCARESIDYPENLNTPEILFLEAQLKDYAVSLMWNYIKWKENSHVWSLLEQADELKRRSDTNG